MIVVGFFLVVIKMVVLGVWERGKSGLEKS